MLGEEFGEPARDKEVDEDYCRRVFGVDAFHRSKRLAPPASGAIGPDIGRAPSDQFVTEALGREMRRRGISGGL